MLISGDSCCKEPPLFLHPIGLLAIHLELSSVTLGVITLSLSSFSVSVFFLSGMKPIVRNPERRPLSLTESRKLSRHFFILFFLFFFFWLRWVFVAARGLQELRRAGATLFCGAWASHCGGFSCCRARALGARASVVVALGLSSCGAQA